MSGGFGKQEILGSTTTEDEMKTCKLLTAMAVLLWAALPVVSQEKPGTIEAFEFQKPKNGMVKQYEEGRKQKEAWHKQQNDSQPLMVWEVRTGPDTGTYVIGRVDQHWADFDKPSIPDQADLDEYQKVVANYVDSMVAVYYEYLPKISNPATDNTVHKFGEIITFHLRYGKRADFMSAVGAVHLAGMKTNWPVHYEWFELVSGGDADEVVLVIPHDSWADFEDNPQVKPFRDMLKDAFGQAEEDSVMNRLNNSVEKETTSVIEFRSDLSYMPGK
jgi:hypothetical protein